MNKKEMKEMITYYTTMLNRLFKIEDKTENDKQSYSEYLEKKLNLEHLVKYA